MDEPKVREGRGFDRTLGRRLGGLCLFVLLGLVSLTPGLRELDESLRPVAEVAGSAPTALRRLDIGSEARPGPQPYIFRLTYPKDWLDDQQQSSPPLAVFVDGRQATWLNEEPYFEKLNPKGIYAYLREPASQSFFVICPQLGACGRVQLVRDHWTTRFVLAWRAPGIVFPALLRLGGQTLLLGGLAWLVSTQVAAFLFILLLGTIAALASFPELSQGGGAVPLAMEATVAALLARPLWRGFGLFSDWALRVISEPSAPITVRQAVLFLIVAVVSAWPGLRTIPDWYPAETDDSHFYVSSASRFLRTDDLLHSAVRPENWRYSAYPVILATFSRLLGMHPMDAFPWASVAGALSLVMAVGGFAWIATGRLRTALLATWVAGMWGGLGGWAWLLERGSVFLSGGGLRLLDTDYHEPRFLGEFTGPFSELTTYLTSAPFYPREAGLVPFWLGLGLLYRRLKPGVKAPSLLYVCALLLMSTAIYPYYGLAAPLALAVVAAVEWSGDPEMRRRSRRTTGAGLLVLVLAVALGDFASRVYRGTSAWEWLKHFIEAAPVAQAANKSMPSLEFLPARMLGGEFFFALAFVMSLVLAYRPPDSISDPQRRAAFVSVFLCVAHGVLNQASAFLHALFFNFRWFVSWRALLAPVAAMAAALFIEQTVIRARSRRGSVLAALALVPALSSVLWSYSVTDYLDRGRLEGTGRGLVAPLWSEYKTHGRSLLGHVFIPEPMAIEGATLGERWTASAAFGIAVYEADQLFANGAAMLTTHLGTAPFVNSIALRRGSVASSRMKGSDCCVWLATYGPYDIYTRRKPGPVQ